MLIINVLHKNSRIIKTTNLEHWFDTKMLINDNIFNCKKQSDQCVFNVLQTFVIFCLPGQLFLKCLFSGLITFKLLFSDNQQCSQISKLDVKRHFLSFKFHLNLVFS